MSKMLGTLYINLVLTWNSQDFNFTAQKGPSVKLRVKFLDSGKQEVSKAAGGLWQR